MDKSLINFVTRVIERADREHPADTVLRDEFRRARGLAREDSATISAQVFAYYRWLNFLPAKSTLAQQAGEAYARDLDFQNGKWQPAENEWHKCAPAWINSVMDVTPAWLQSLQPKPLIWLRARPGRGAEVANSLFDCQTASPTLTDTLRYFGHLDLFRTAEFQAGVFELQDLSSQITGLLCDAKPTETWWDACAGEGGKALHLGDLMQNKGLLWATDRAEWRLKRFRQRAARAKLFNHRSALWDGSARLPNKTKFDGILVDAPCSGIGTWQRNPYARWTTAPTDVTELSVIQKDLVANASKALKPGGRLIYSVCTLARPETSEVFEHITASHPELEPLTFLNPLKSTPAPLTQLWLWPQEIHGNGMFICGWRKRA